MRFRLILIYSFVISFAFAQEGTPRSIPESARVEVAPEASDEIVAERLRGLFSEVDAMSRVEVKVSGGVVTLSGSVPSSKAREEVIALTGRTEGVVYVQDQIDDLVEVSARLGPAREKAVELWKQTLAKLPLMLIALACVLLSWFVGSWISQRRSWFRKVGLNELSASLLGRVLKLLVIGFGIFIALEILDATSVAAGVLGVAGVTGVALGFAFRNIVENYLAGILLSTRNPFSTGDAVEIGEHSGKIVRLTSRDTVLMTYDGNHLRIPNSVIITSAMTNFSRNPLRRFDFSIGVSTDLDLSEVRELGIKTLEGISNILDDPAPYVLIEALGDSAVNMRFFGWVDQRESDFLKTKSEAIRVVKVAFDDANIEMPEPIYRVHLREAVKETTQPSAPRSTSQTVEADLGVDDTIDRQLASVQANDGEGNLLDQ